MTPLIKKALNTSKSAMDKSYHSNVSLKNDVSNLMRDLSSDKVDKDAIFNVLQKVLKNSESTAESIKEAQGWLESVIQSAE